MTQAKAQLSQDGYGEAKAIYSRKETAAIKKLIAEWISANSADGLPKEVFAIRRLLQQIPALKGLLFNEKLKALVSELGEPNTFLVKALFFDKPEGFNWLVSYHQDISITVDQRIETDGYGKWTTKHGQIGVVPPVDILESIFTVRIHLDDTDEHNGALRIIPKSHLKGIRSPKEIVEEQQNEVLCPIKEGDVMLMKPLTFHASSKTEMTNRRRVIHLEFTHQELAKPLNWREKEHLS
jgi:ectoine hydroxylase-related dioxygenase (phytanoyl-CoA dioxygenase family)